MDEGDHVLARFICPWHLDTGPLGDLRDRRAVRAGGAGASLIRELSPEHRLVIAR
jgi:hypothetical protein